jgi:peptidoglycan/LPS O-acetylase OafA/YrhL
MQMRNKRLDVLRCIAVLLVVLFHGPVRSRLARVGWVGVDLFFVLSGFLIAGLLFSEYKQRGGIVFKRFFIRRGFKIYPAFYVFLATGLLIELHGHRLSSLGQYLSEIFYVQNYAEFIYPHTWSLAVEEHFYILLPIFLLLLIRFSSNRADPFRNLPLAFVVVALTCLTLRIVTAFRIPPADLRLWLVARRVGAPTHERVDSLFFGVLLSYLVHFRPGFLDALFGRARNQWIFAIVAAGMILPVLFVSDGNRFMITIGLTMLYVGFGIVLMLCLYSRGIVPPRLAGSLAAVGSGFAFVGMYSYSIYLWHLTAPYLAWHFVRSSLPATQLSFDVVYFVVSIAFGIFMARLIEYPFLSLRDRIFPSMQSKPPCLAHGPRLK